MVPKMLENNAQVLSMVLLILGINKDVINENHDELVKLRHEYRVHEIHEIHYLANKCGLHRCFLSLVHRFIRCYFYVCFFGLFNRRIEFS